MSTLDRYILKAFIRNLTLVMLTLVVLYGLIEFLEKIDDFIEYQAELSYYLRYPLYSLPLIMFNSLPMAVLLATFATIGGLSRTSQLTAMFSGGISFNRISRPLFLCSLALAILVVFANLWLVPWSSRESNYLLRTEIRGKDAPEVTSRDLYFRDGDRIISVSQAFPERKIVRGLTILEFDDNFMPVKRIQADQAAYVKDGFWKLENAVIWVFDPGTRTTTAFDRPPDLIVDLKRRASEMLQISDRPEDLTINELFNTAAKLHAEGYDPKAYQVEAQMRFARAVIPIIMVLIGLPFAMQRGRNSSFSLGIVLSLVIFAGYFILQAIFAVFGTIAVLPPPVAAWAANFLMTLVGVWFFLRAQM